MEPTRYCPARQCRLRARLIRNVSRINKEEIGSDQITRKTKFGSGGGERGDGLWHVIEPFVKVGHARRAARGGSERPMLRADASLANHGDGGIEARLKRPAGLIGHLRSRREAAPLWGSSLHSRTPQCFVCARSFQKPANRQMEPTLLTVCAILSPRRAAHLQRWADDKKETQL